MLTVAAMSRYTAFNFQFQFQSYTSMPVIPASAASPAAMLWSGGCRRKCVQDGGLPQQHDQPLDLQRLAIACAQQRIRPRVHLQPGHVLLRI